MGTAFTSKDRRHSGWTSPRSTLMMNRQKMIDEALEPQDFWDDWKDHRDGLRVSRDRKQLRNPHSRWGKYFNIEEWNSKLKKLIFRRRMRRDKINERILLQKFS